MDPAYEFNRQIRGRSINPSKGEDGDLKDRNTLIGLIKDGNTSKLLSVVQTDLFSKHMERAYDSKGGFSIGTIDGVRVMFVGGVSTQKEALMAMTEWTKSGKKWSKSNMDEKAARYESIAKDNKVQVVVGHSRGAGIVSRMDGPWQKLSLDGAMYLAKKKAKDTINLHRQGLFDRMIASTGKKNKGVKGTGHFVYRRIPVRSNLARAYAFDKDMVTSRKVKSKYTHDLVRDRLNYWHNKRSKRTIDLLEKYGGAYVPAYWKKPLKRLHDANDPATYAKYKAYYDKGKAYYTAYRKWRNKTR